MIGVTKLYFEKSKISTLVLQLLEERREGPGRVHRPVGEIRLPVPRHLEGFLQRLGRLVVETHDELRLHEDVGLAQEADRLLVVLDLGLLVELVELHLRGRLGAERDVHEPRLAVEAAEAPCRA
jgi:hypothetical protein